jgi:hypothetical protein
MTFRRRYVKRLTRQMACQIRTSPSHKHSSDRGRSLANNIVDVGSAERYIAPYGTLMSDDSYIGPRQHLLLLGCIGLAGVVLACAPHAVLGLHYQCLLSRATSIRCPFCGMTRDFILMSKGSLPRNNPGSLFVAVAGYVVYPIWFVVAALCRPAWLLVSRNSVQKALAAIIAVLFVCNNF